MVYYSSCIPLVQITAFFLCAILDNCLCCSCPLPTYLLRKVIIEDWSACLLVSLNKDLWAAWTWYRHENGTVAYTISFYILSILQSGYTTFEQKYTSEFSRLKMKKAPQVLEYLSTFCSGGNPIPNDLSCSQLLITTDCINTFRYNYSMALWITPRLGNTTP